MQTWLLLRRMSADMADKLIIISGIEGVIELLHLILNLNLINQFYIEIKEIQSLPRQLDLFQIIIK